MPLLVLHEAQVGTGFEHVGGESTTGKLSTGASNSSAQLRA